MGKGANFGLKHQGTGQLKLRQWFIHAISWRCGGPVELPATICPAPGLPQPGCVGSGASQSGLGSLLLLVFGYPAQRLIEQLIGLIQCSHRAARCAPGWLTNVGLSGIAPPVG